jgi:preprotein translocase YajC subunit
MQTSSFIYHAALFATTAKKSSSGSFIPYALILVFFGVYFLYLRPKRNLLRQQQMQHRTFDVGDEVVTTSGIVGTVLSLDGDRLTLETGHGHTLTVLRSAVARRVDPPIPDLGDDPDGAPDGEHGENWWPEGGKDDEAPGSNGGPS